MADRKRKIVLRVPVTQELLDRGVDRKNIIFINFESLRYEALRDYKALYAEIIKIAGQTEGRIYVLLDEIQEVNTWEQVINSLRVDLDCDIYVTGSNAKLLSGELADVKMVNPGEDILVISDDGTIIRMASS